MAEVTITTEEKKEEPKADSFEVGKALKAADDYQKLKEANDRLETEILRGEELKRRQMTAGKATAGSVEKSQEEIDNEEAAKLLSLYKS